ncbi:bile acid:sodium symporter family protein [Frigidibacter sp. MR17.24]|uniref:bile acid:sodium symporter family protein n=1 Tax=Frigidibacter sp. MR17.24 TaxID=3127345 RepID=UPI003012EF34
MAFLKRLGIDTYMLLLIATVVLGVVLPVRGIFADGLKQVTFWAVALLFFLYGAKLNAAAVRAGLMNWRLQALTFVVTYAMFPILGLAITWAAGPLLTPETRLGILFLSVLPSTVQSSIAFTSMVGGNVPAAICAASVSNLVGVVLTPVLVTVILHQGGATVQGDAAVKIAMQILLPFVIGQLLRRWIGGWVARHKTLTMVVDRGSILLIVYSAFSAGTVAGLWHVLSPADLVTLYLVVVAFLALAMLAMAGLGRATGMAFEDRAVLFFCGSTKSLASGLPIATALFPAATLGAVVLPTMLYHLSQLFVCAVVAQRGAARLAGEGAPARA